MVPALLLMFVLGTLNGPIQVTRAAPAAVDNLRVVASFVSEGYDVKLIYNGTHPSITRNGEAEEPLNVHLGPGCPDDPETMALITRTPVSVWSPGNKAECTWIMDAGEEIEVRMAAGSFWKVRPPHNASSKPDHVGPVAFPASYGVWALVE
jgi:hypothetical protein